MKPYKKQNNYTGIKKKLPKRFLVEYVFFFLVLINVCKAQPENKFVPGVEGQLAVTTNGKAVFMSIGGVSLKFIFKKFTVGINMGPALKFESENSKITTVPVLGVGPQIYFLKDKRFFLNFPAYYIGSKKIWTQSAGIGYVLTKPK